MSKAKYVYIIKYDIEAKCQEPLHIGSGEGGGEVLLHPIAGVPFVQASSIAGVFRAYCEQTNKDVLNNMYGDSETTESKIIFSDGTLGEEAKIELRPRVSIDRQSGAVSSLDTKNRQNKSGGKFEVEYVSAGTSLRFSSTIKALTEEEVKMYEKIFEDTLKALARGEIQFGGQKSNGCGYISFKNIEKSSYNMKNEKDREEWIKGETVKKESVKISANNTTITGRYRIIMEGKTKGSVLVKGLATIGDDIENTPDASNMRNGNGDYIVPGSSIKGVIRTQANRIIKYLKLDGFTIDNMFGKNKDNADGQIGVVRCYDMVVGSQKDNGLVQPQTRIRIDKFTGGVMYGGLFEEKPAYGNCKIVIDIIDKDNTIARKSCAIVLMVLRDIAKGQLSLGGGYSIGRGFIEAEGITVLHGEKNAKIDMTKDGQMDNETIKDIWASLKEEVQK